MRQTDCSRCILLQLLTGCSVLQGSANEPYEEPDEILPDRVRLAESGMSSAVYGISVIVSLELPMLVLDGRGFGRRYTLVVVWQLICFSSRFTVIQSVTHCW
jgi:hypothetical protein